MRMWTKSGFGHGLFYMSVGVENIKNSLRSGGGWVYRLFHGLSCGEMSVYCESN